MFIWIILVSLVTALTSVYFYNRRDTTMAILILILGFLINIALVQDMGAS